MNQEFVEKWSELAKNAQQPFQKLAELNVKTIQGLSYVKPDDLANIKNPEELAEKNLEIIIQNGHKLLDYMQQSFQLFEKSMITVLKETKKKTEDLKK